MRDRIAILCMLLALALIGPLGSPPARRSMWTHPSRPTVLSATTRPTGPAAAGPPSPTGRWEAPRPPRAPRHRPAPEGSYREVLSPQRSGTAGNAIAFKGFSGETATLTGVDQPAILLKNLSWLIVEGLTVHGCAGVGRIEGSNDITIRNNRFAGATARGTTGGLKFVRSARNRILNNTFEEGNDSLVLQESDRNLVQGNAFTSARHSLLSIRAGITT
jgi:parallel beta-helix repeat protein